ACRSFFTRCDRIGRGATELITSYRRAAYQNSQAISPNGSTFPKTTMPSAATVSTCSPENVRSGRALSIIFLLWFYVPRTIPAVNSPEVSSGYLRQSRGRDLLSGRYTRLHEAFTCRERDTVRIEDYALIGD